MERKNCICMNCMDMDECRRDKTDIIFKVMDGENDVTLTDDKGIVLRVSGSYELHYGVSIDEVVGKSVYDLERAGIFTPSVTVSVLKERKKVTILQENKLGETVLTTGVPIFDEKGKLEYVISFNSIDIAEMTTLHEKYEKLNGIMQEYNSQIQYLKMKEFQDSTFITRSKSMSDINDLLMQVADIDANVLITGETGVGKSMVAKILHRISNRAEGPLVEINCGAIPPTLIESELFGYEKGAFTGANSKGKAGKIELANRGVLFLDEIGELPLDLQIKLLQVIQQKTISRVGGLKKINVDFRLVTATNRDLEKAVRRGEFREDLYYRLNVIAINIPPLRERKDDIVPLIDNFSKRFNALYNKNLTISPEAMTMMEAYSWPGNIRQVENFVERLTVTFKDEVVTEDDLPKEFRVSKARSINYSENSLVDLVEEFEKEIFINVFEKYKTSIAVGKALDISQTTAARKLRKYIPGYVSKRFENNS